MEMISIYKAIRSSFYYVDNFEFTFNFNSVSPGSYGKSGNQVRASFAGRENKAFSLGEKTRASFTARDSRASLTAPRRNVSEEVRMRNLEVMAEYEGTRTYRSAVSSEYENELHA